VSLDKQVGRCVQLQYDQSKKKNTIPRVRPRDKKNNGPLHKNGAAAEGAALSYRTLISSSIECGYYGSRYYGSIRLATRLLVYEVKRKLTPVIQSYSKGDDVSTTAPRLAAAAAAA
jgi:hypothetical protein